MSERALPLLWESVGSAHAEGDVEETLKALATFLRADSEQESDSAVKGALESAADHCDHAAMDYYVSTK